LGSTEIWGILSFVVCKTSKQRKGNLGNPDHQGLVDTPKRVSKMFEEIFADLAKDPREHAETVFKEVPGKAKPPFGSEEWFCFLVDVSTSCASQSIRS